MKRTSNSVFARKISLIGGGTSLLVTGALLVGGPAGASSPQTSSSTNAAKPSMVAPSAITVPPGGNTISTATCPAGSTVTSGGARTSGVNIYLTDSYKDNNGWSVRGSNTGTASQTITAYAYCESTTSIAAP
jgi:hypothetical protein